MKIEVGVALFDHPDLLEADEELIGDVLEAITKHNVRVMAVYGLPPLAESGVRYRPEPPTGDRRRAREQFSGALEVYQRGWGDCDDLAPIRAAERRLRGEKRAEVVLRPSYGAPPGTNYHILVTGPRGDEDPSLDLGMNRSA